MIQEINGTWNKTKDFIAPNGILQSISTTDARNLGEGIFYFEIQTPANGVISNRWIGLTSNIDPPWMFNGTMPDTFRMITGGNVALNTTYGIEIDLISSNVGKARYAINDGGFSAWFEIRDYSGKALSSFRPAVGSSASANPESSFKINSGQEDFVKQSDSTKGETVYSFDGTRRAFKVNKILISSEENKYHSMISGIAKYSFEETGDTIIDSLGNNSGVNYGSTIVQGYKGNARSFNGTNSYIQFTNRVIPAGEKSIRFKMKKSAIPSKLEVIVENGFASTGHGTRIQVRTNGQLIMTILQGINGDYFDLPTNKNVCDGQWHDILFTWDGTTKPNGAKVYVDDMTKADNQSTVWFHQTTDGSGDMVIGRNFHQSDRFFKGELDEVEIYDYVINPSSPNILISMDDASEDNFIKYGADSINDLHTPIGNIKSVINKSDNLGDGKIFTHTLDMSKYRGKNIILS